MWIAYLVLALQAPAAIPAPQFDAKAAQELLEHHSTAFGPSTRRSRLEVRRMAPLGDPVPAGRGYFVELAWVQAGADEDRAEVGVATVTRIEELPADTRIFGLVGGWALADLAVDKPWDLFMMELAVARASAAEASACNALRGVLAGQEIFSARAEAGGAFAGNLGCLTKPTECLEGYTGGPFFEMPGGGIPGYELTLRGPAIAGRKPGLASAFVATAVPAPPANDRSAFCADASGRLCLLKDPEAVESACPAECAPVE